MFDLEAYELVWPLLKTRTKHKREPAYNYSISKHRRDAARNMARFYQLRIEPSLFGGVLLITCWGRIGTQGRVRAREFE